MTAPALFPFNPNWRESCKVSYEFKTDIATSRSNREQRRALRTTPRKKISFKVTLAHVAPLDRFMARYQNQEVALADMSRHVLTTTPLLEGDSVFPVDPPPNSIPPPPPLP